MQFLCSLLCKKKKLYTPVHVTFKCNIWCKYLTLNNGSCDYSTLYLQMQFFVQRFNINKLIQIHQSTSSSNAVFSVHLWFSATFIINALFALFIISQNCSKLFWCFGCIFLNAFKATCLCLQGYWSNPMRFPLNFRECSTWNLWRTVLCGFGVVVWQFFESVVQAAFFSFN